MSEQADRRRSSRVPRVADLRPIAQGVKTEADSRWSYRAFRMVSIYVTWAFLHTRVSPNQVTILSLVTAVAGLIMIGLPGPAWAIVGCVLLLSYHLLDRVDGELARYLERYSLLGIYLDNAGHYLTSGGVMVAVAFRVSEYAGDPRWVWLVGSLGAIAAILSRIEKHAAFQLFSQYVMKRPELVDTVGKGSGLVTKQTLDATRAEGAARPSLVPRLGNLILTLSWFPVSVGIFMAGFVAEETGVGGASTLSLWLVSGIQMIAYLGVELANLTGNLGSETRRLASLPGSESTTDR